MFSINQHSPTHTLEQKNGRPGVNNFHSAGPNESIKRKTREESGKEATGKGENEPQEMKFSSRKEWKKSLVTDGNCD